MAGSLSEREIEGILEEAIEELTIQNVVLDSMRTESWPGIELERQELTDKIERLKDKIRRIRQGSWGRSDGVFPCASFLLLTELMAVFY